jgi:hypothetical protein
MTTNEQPAAPVEEAQTNGQRPGKVYLPLWGGRHPEHERIVKAFLEYATVTAVATATGISRRTLTRWKAHEPNWLEVLACRKELAAKSPLESRVAELEVAVFGREPR